MTSYFDDTGSLKYAFIHEGDSYFAYHLDRTYWDRATFDQRDASLVMATRMIDLLRIRGRRASAEQQLRFPREGETEVPTNVKRACLELALELLKGRRAEEELGMAVTTSIAYANIREARSGDPNMQLPHIVAGIPSLAAWQLLLPYIEVGTEVGLRRI